MTKVNISSAGGTAAKGSKTCKITLPAKWIEAIGIDEEHRDLELTFDGAKAVLPIKTAFGHNQLLNWNDFLRFLAERCIPRQRTGLREYLEALGLDEYDPFTIIKKTGGRMAEEQQWLEIEVMTFQRVTDEK